MTQNARWIGVVMALGVLLLGLLLLAGRSGQLDRAATGFDGLRHWLAANGQEARGFAGGYPIDAEAIGLRVLPVFDTMPDFVSDPPRDLREELLDDSERDIGWDILQRKVAAAPTLVILPKWRAGMRLTGVAHPDLLIGDKAVQGLARWALGPGAGLTTNARGGIEAVPLTWSSDGTADRAGQDFVAEIYAPRSAVAPACTPLLGDAVAAYLLRCPIRGAAEGAVSTVFVLTDPDLLNNHGLSLGQNADLAAAVLPALAGTGAVIVDSSTGFWTRTTRVRQPAERSWADLARFFAWPYALIWLGFAALFGLALWRGGVRTRPPLPEATAPQLATVEAEARLLLLSGDRARLLGDYAAQRLAALAEALLGLRAGVAGLRRVLARRAPDLAATLFNAADAMHHLPADIAPAEAQARIRDFEELIERVRHELD
jgi:hypothetical protein